MDIVFLKAKNAMLMPNIMNYCILKWRTKKKSVNSLRIHNELICGINDKNLVVKNKASVRPDCVRVANVRVHECSRVLYFQIPHIFCLH